MKAAAKASFVLFLAGLVLFGADTYQKPPQAVLDILNSPATPALSISPTKAYAMQGRPVRNPPIAELAQPMLRLAGIRINPETNGLHNTTFNTTLTLMKFPEGTEIKVALPPTPRLSAGRWSPDGNHFAFTNSTVKGIELWIGDTATGKTHRIAGVRINDVFGGGGGRGGAGGGSVQWLSDSRTLLVQMVKPNRGAAPPAPTVPAGPNVQESLGGGRGVVTHEDMLQSAHDEDLFEFYATSQLAMVDSATGKVTPVGKAAIVESARVSPDRNYLMVTSIHRPFSYLHQARQFPKEIEVWDRSGKVVHKVASLPLATGGRGGGTGPDDQQAPPPPRGTRNLQWRFNEPATLMWIDSIGDVPRNNSSRGAGARGGAAQSGDTPPPPRPEHILALKAPFTGAPVELFKSEQAIPGITMFENGRWALLSAGGGRGGRGGGGAAPSGPGASRTARATLIDLDKPEQAPRLLWSYNSADRYANPGSPLEKIMSTGDRAIILDGDHIFLSSVGPSPTGDHPFLDRFNLTALKSERLFRCDDDHYEIVEGLLDPHGDRFLTRRESPTEPPNYFVRTAGGKLTAATHFPDPQPIMRKVKKQLVTYKRNDGVELSFTLYLPPDYKEGTKLPTVVWAYPREYDDTAAADQVATSGSTKRFTEIGGYSQLFFVLDGYAVLDNAAMPIVGERRTVNDHFVEQVVMDAKAAIDKAVEMGVTDPARVGVGGHSYGAFMTDTLLAHSDLFKAGIAESGAPNRTLTPFGFQSERRTLWQAPDLYIKISPFMYADKVKTPLLLIHGEADDNDGTFPIQSQRMYEAVRGNGGIVRLVFLPFEAHGYRGKETIEHVLWEKFAWFDKYVKGAGAAGTSN